MADQREEMERFGLGASRHTLEFMQGILPWDIELGLDVGILTRNLNEAQKLLECNGERDIDTVRQMKQLVYLNSVMVEKYIL